MTLQEVNKRFHIKMETLQFYEEKGLLKGKKKQKGDMEYQEKDIQQAIQLYSFLKAGADLDTLQHFVSLTKVDTNTTIEQIKTLRKCRYQLLDEIHKKQESLDRLDYFMQEIKNQCRKVES